MTLPFPVHVAASGLEGLIWLIVGAIWLVFQGLAKAAKKNAPPMQRPTPPEEATEQPFGGELDDLIETLTGQKRELPEADEAPALPRPAPPRHLPPVQSKTSRPTPAIVAPIVTQPALPMVTAAQLHSTQTPMRVAPLLKMKWPRSALGNLSVTAATRTGQTSPLRRQLMGHTALRHAMVSRIVLGAPGGR
ncbi:MAG: hypothetical protein EPN23_06680 [Verrucomicrobia bacterium]|nr:MAG: hypothetical protein EPN23_06680 [Verrucomicrobiota bacterium]